ncbi:MAG: bi-domain-containing oxidoreductase [bacterium]
MKQVTQSLKTGEIKVEQVPHPPVLPGYVLVKNMSSLISTGTERSKIEMGEKNIVQKALARPDLAKQVLQKIRQEGFLSTFHKVKHRLESASPLGYSCAGTVVTTGGDVKDISAGDRVACAGAGYANHAEVVSVPVNLTSKIPDGVSYDHASFVTLGAIALQGVRQTDIRLGEHVCVIGLGLLGQITVELLKSAGCNAYGIDLDEKKVKLSETLGARKSIMRSDDVELFAHTMTGGFGFDAVIITAAAATNDPVILAGNICRDRGKVVVVGNVRMDIPRQGFYEKELSVIMSRSYGPGRYDPVYEEKHIDYPIGYVRWTEKRNMEEFLRLVGSGMVSLEPLISHHFPVDEAAQAYRFIAGKAQEPFLGIILQYGQDSQTMADRIPVPEAPVQKHDALQIGLIGAGNFTSGVLLPRLKKLPEVAFHSVCSTMGVSTKNVAQKFGFAYAVSDAQHIIQDPACSTVFITTTHQYHAEYASQALAEGKAVFVEKPLALNFEELQRVQSAVKTNSRLMVGFNRRFSPHTALMKEIVQERKGACIIICRVNAGPIPHDSWIHDPSVGGGRINSEVCHFIDLICYLVGSKPRSIITKAVSGNDPDAALHDNIILTVQFADGSIGSVVYTSKGDALMGKEYIELFTDGISIRCDDFKRTDIMKRNKTIKKLHTSQDKGHTGEFDAFVNAVRSGKQMPIPFDELYMSTKSTLMAVESLRNGKEESI